MPPTDALIIGAGPVGLYQAFQLGLLGLRSCLVDALPHVGGQCAELYPDKPIYDIPGIPVCTGQELVDRLHTQIRPFAPPCHLGHLVQRLERQHDLWHAKTDQGLEIFAQVVIIAAGVGAFVPKTLSLSGADAFLGRHFHYKLDSHPSLSNQRVVVLGGDDLALTWVDQLAAATPGPSHISLLYRRPTLAASAASQERFYALCQTQRVSQFVGQATRLKSIDAMAQVLAQLEYTAVDGSTQVLDADAVLAATGLSPKLGPLAHWGLDLERKQLPVNPATCQTAEPGLFAVGDINTYPGKKKLIACGFHECVMAAYAVAEIVKPGETGPLQYTTSSTLLQQRLGV